MGVLCLFVFVFEADAAVKLLAAEVPPWRVAKSASLAPLGAVSGQRECLCLCLCLSLGGALHTRDTVVGVVPIVFCSVKSRRVEATRLLS